MGYTAFDLKGKVALVTGGNGGIGFGMADALAQAGADVAIWGTNAEKNAKAEAELRRHGGKVLALKCNVADEKAVEAATAETLAKMGRIDACFANAGVGGKSSSFTELSTDEWRRVLSVNLDGVFYTLRASARHMVDRAKNNDPGGSLVLLASTAAVHGAARNTQYAATKGAMVAMTKALAVEMARYQITANAILPGWIESEMTVNAMANEKFAGAVLPRIPARRWGKNTDFGPIAVYLTSPASRYHTGDLIVIDGAYTIF